jgi:hypothetical protein
MRSKGAPKGFIVFALSLMLAVWALPTVNAMAKTVILGGGAVALEIVGEVNNSAPGVVPATSEIFGYLSKVDGIDQVFTDSDPTHQNESTALITFDTDATTIRVTPHGPFRITATERLRCTSTTGRRLSAIPRRSDRELLFRSRRFISK